jgi:TrmH family RNA methyltransferase
MYPDPPSTPNLLANACIVLVRTEGPVNLGMIARLCGNLGVTDLRLVAPITAIDCEEARKFSTHSRELLLNAPVFPHLAAAVADCGLVVGTSARSRHREFGEGIRVQEVPALLAARPARRWALVFGNEADGLDEAELRCCQAWVHLDTPGSNPAFNLAMSVAITGYCITCLQPAPGTDQPPAAERGHVAGLFDYAMETCDRIQYFRRTDRRRFGPLFERFLNRLHLSPVDVQSLRGILAQVNYFAFGKRFDRHDR